MMPTDDEMSIREIARTISDFRQEFRAQVSQLLRNDVYRAEQAAMEARVKRIEEDRVREESERDSFRRLVYGAFVSAAGSLVVALIMFLVASRH